MGKYLLSLWVLIVIGVCVNLLFELIDSQGVIFFGGGFVVIVVLLCLIRLILLVIVVVYGVLFLKGYDWILVLFLVGQFLLMNLFYECQDMLNLFKVGFGWWSVFIVFIFVVFIILYFNGCLDIVFIVYIVMWLSGVFFCLFGYLLFLFVVC